MPEGPEIRLAADKIEQVLAGEIIEAVVFGLPKLKRFQQILQGNRINSIETRGKAMLTHFAHGWSIYSHNQLYGVWKVVKRGRIPPTNRQLRLALHTSSDSALLYSASDISVWKSSEVNEHPFLQRIGPDILDARLDWQTVAQRLGEDKFRGRKLAAIYLDQAFLAGVGNYLRSEILFAAKINPALKAGDLTAAQRQRLARQTLRVSKASYRHAGVTLAQKDYRALRDRGVTHGKARFMVFGRAGVACRACANKIKRIEASARRLYFCPVCQA